MKVDVSRAVPDLPPATPEWEAKRSETEPVGDAIRGDEREREILGGRLDLFRVQSCTGRKVRLEKECRPRNDEN